MKIITVSQIGYNSPSQANWSYGIFKIDLIDTTKDYCMSFTAKESFGGDKRFAKKMFGKGVKVLEVKGVYTATGTPKITGVSKLPDMETDEFVAEVLEWHKGK